MRVFNTTCNKDQWDAAYKPDFLYFDIPADKTYKEAFIASWEAADPDDRVKVKDLPNFDADVFYEISGIRL